tara:strand:- start:41 stop:445 length:405 start_codon:yes stop_codon:yes gene_type:complete
MSVKRTGTYFSRDGDGRIIGGGSIKKKKNQTDKQGAEVNIVDNVAQARMAAQNPLMGASPNYESSIPISAQAAKADAENAAFFGRPPTDFGRPIGKDRTSPAASRAMGDTSPRPASRASARRMALKEANKKRKQ